MKKLISIILSLVFCVSVLAAIPVSAETAPSAPVYYGTQQVSVADNKQNIRFISLVDSALGTSVGYEIKAKYSTGEKTFNYEETKSSVVYSSVIADSITYGFDDLGAEFGLMTMVIEGIPTNIGAIDFAVTPCVEYGGNVIAGETRVVRYNGTKCEGNVEDPREISVMSFNVLNVWYDGINKLEGVSVKDRSNATSEIVLENNLDFVCFQEFDPLYRENANFDTEFTAKYSELDLTAKKYDKQNQKTVTYQSRIWNPIFYDNTQYTVVASGVFDFVEWELGSYESDYNYTHGEEYSNKSDARSLVWGVFRHKTTGETYIVSNTHFSPLANGSISKAKLNEAEGNFVVGKLNELYAEHGCPVIACGDYNSYERDTMPEYDEDNNNGYLDVISAGFYDTWYLAPESNRTDSNGYHNNCINR
ncbi:MAG: hypothetical protein IKJ00_09385, partial [Clostridia bacterium]|nr:hypothetical protein [Clostridia bacterium]